MKLFLSCPVLLDFSILFQIFCPGLQHIERFSKLGMPITIPNTGTRLTEKQHQEIGEEEHMQSQSVMCFTQMQ